MKSLKLLSVLFLMLVSTFSISATTITLASDPVDLGTDWTKFVDLRYCDFSQVKEGDVLKVSYTLNAGAASGQLQLQKAWAEYKTLNDVTAAGTWDVTIDADLLTALNARDNGVVIKGQNLTVTSVVVSTKEEVNTDIVLSDTTIDLGTDWSKFVDLRYCDYSKVDTGDVLTIDYAARENAQIQIQSNWKEYKTYNDLTGTGTIKLTIDADLLAKLKARDEGIVIKGQNAAITSVVIKKTVTGVTEVSYVKPTVADNAYYTLNGRRLAEPTTTGIYIHQGKKLFIRK